jgi:hypothetical protein
MDAAIITETFISISTQRGGLTFPLTEQAALSMTSAELRTLCYSNDPNGEWGTFTTLMFECAECAGDGCDDCNHDGNIVRQAVEDEQFLDEDVFEWGCDRADLVEGAVMFGQECLMEELAAKARAGATITK